MMYRSRGVYAVWNCSIAPSCCICRAWTSCTSSTMSPSFFFVCPTIHRRWQNPTQNFQEVADVENACPRSGGGGQALNTKGWNLTHIFGMTALSFRPILYPWIKSSSNSTRFFKIIIQKTIIVQKINIFFIKSDNGLEKFF